MRVEREKKFKRLGGYRRLGHVHLAGGEAVTKCDRLPYILGKCPTCGSGVVPSRQAKTVTDPVTFFGGTHDPCAHGTHRTSCEICYPNMTPMLLVWLATRKSLPAAWLEEVKRLGISWPLFRIPKGFVIGRSPVLVACSKPEPTIFAYFIPDRVETVITFSATQDFGAMMTLQKRKITPFFIDDDDEDYQNGSR